MKPTRKQVAQAKLEIALENQKHRHALEQDEEYQRKVRENARRAALPSEHPDHICGMMCDGQDGSNSYCVRLRQKLFTKRGGR